MNDATLRQVSEFLKRVEGATYPRAVLRDIIDSFAKTERRVALEETQRALGEALEAFRRPLILGQYTWLQVCVLSRAAVVLGDKKILEQIQTAGIASCAWLTDSIENRARARAAWIAFIDTFLLLKGAEEAKKFAFSVREKFPRPLLFFRIATDTRDVEYLKTGMGYLNSFVQGMDGANKSAALAELLCEAVRTEVLLGRSDMANTTESDPVLSRFPSVHLEVLRHIIGSKPDEGIIRRMRSLVNGVPEEDKKERLLLSCMVADAISSVSDRYERYASELFVALNMMISSVSESSSEFNRHYYHLARAFWNNENCAKAYCLAERVVDSDLRGELGQLFIKDLVEKKLFNDARGALMLFANNDVARVEALCVTASAGGSQRFLKEAMHIAHSVSDPCGKIHAFCAVLECLQSKKAE
ncbi:hypothetical protein HYV44_01005 [Candidatus Microgenomates bacterium]|nr:hypothetical protein [Candidatus Microgenomates bacterium]